MSTLPGESPENMGVGSPSAEALLRIFGQSLEFIPGGTSLAIVRLLS